MHLSALCSLLLRDGTFYFFSLLDLSLAELLLHVQLDENFGTSRTYFIAPLAPILIARFLLNLRMLPLVQGLGSQELSYDQSISELPSIEFASRMLGNIGAPLDDGLSDASDWENRADSDEDEDEDESS
ncbi:hypothetical protein WOLCODRAFT_155250 [Wolfiporia cocos MD-104 SS10]|uniref:Uncharacterized protein n=1 Tax=Wolfiporia cocos (strain MD-104) TaxID=742152 RepID=A0A2H3J489_WOLCO|nr:hypothetical protein WOLCODRAFT_155250 [Wolfiporia cocos MD-104 SS10]